MKRLSSNIASFGLTVGLLLIGYSAIAQVHIEPANPVICPGESIVLTVVADNPDNIPTFFAWMPPDGLDDPSAQTVTATLFNTTSYFVETNAGGASVTVTVIDVPFPGWEGLFDTAYCATSGLQALVPSDPDGVFSATPDSTGAFFQDNNDNWFFNPGAYPGGHPHITVTYTTSANGCERTYSRSFRIFPRNDVSFSGLSPTYCSGDPGVTLTGNPAGGNFSTDAPSGLFGNFLDPGQVPVGQPFEIVYAIIDTNSCMAADTQQFIVNQGPDAYWDGIQDITYCGSTPPIALTPHEAGGTFSVVPNAPGAFTFSGGIWYFNLSAYPAGINGLITYTLNDGGACTSSFSRSILSNPLTPVSFSGLSPEYCSGDAPVTLDGSPAGGTFSTTAPSGLFGDQLDPSQVPAGTTFDLTYSYTDGNGCTGEDTQQFIVNQSPSAGWNGISDIPFCASNPPIELTPLEPGGAFTASPNAPGAITSVGGIWYFNPGAYPAGANVVVTYTVSNGGCSASYGRNVTIFPLTNVSFSGLTFNNCANDPIVLLSGNPAGGTFSTTAPSGLNGNMLDPAQVPVGEIFEITYTYTDGNGCAGSQTQDFTVNDLPAVSFCCLNPVYCSNEPAVTLVGSPAGGTFSTTAPTGLSGNVFNPALFPTNDSYPITYTYSNGTCSNSETQYVLVRNAPNASFTGLSPAYCADAPAVTLSGNPTGGTFSTTAPSGLIGNVLDPAQVPPGSTFSISYSFTDGNGCSDTETQSFIVNPLPVVDFSGLAISYCADAPNVILTGAPAGGTFSTNAPSGLSGNVLNPGLVPTGTFWDITYTYTNSNGCTNSKTRDFVVNALPGAGFSLPASFCANDPVYTLAGDPPGGIFSTNAPAGLSGNTLDPSLVPAGVTYSITYTYTDGNFCSGSQTRSFIVHPAPVVNFSGLALSYCADEPPVILSGIPAGGTFSTNAPSGLNGNIMTPADVPPGTFWDITYDYTDANGCSGSYTRDFVVNELPTVSFSGLNPVYCANSPAVTLTGSPAGGVFSTDAPGGLSGNIFTPSQVPPGTYSITYTYTNADFCTGSQTQTFTVQPLPTVSFTGLSPVYCTNAPAVTLTGNPTGGIFSTDAPAGLNGNILTPSDVPTGTTYSILYTYSDGNGCIGVNSQAFTVIPLPPVSFSGLDPVYCANAPQVTLTGEPAGGVFSTNAPGGLNGNVLNPAQVPENIPYTIIYTYTDGNGCANTQTQEFTVLPLPSVSFTGLSPAYCVDAAPVSLTGNPAGGIFSTDAPSGLSGNLLNPGQVPTGTTFGITYSFTDSNGCSNSDMQDFIVHALPVVSFSGLSPDYCIDDPTVVTLNGSPTGGTFSTDAPAGLSGNELTPSLVPAGSVYSITYMFSDGNGCGNQQTQSFTVHDLPVAGLSGLSDSYCADALPVLLSGNPAGGIFITNAPSGLSGNMLDPSQVPTGIVYSVTYQYMDGNGCSDSDTQVFMVNALPSVSFAGLSPVYCASDPAVTLTGDPAGGVFTTDAPSGLNGDVLTPGDVPGGTSFHISYIFTNNNGCVSEQSQSFLVQNPTAVSFSGLSPTYCFSDPAVMLTGSPAGGVFSSTAPTGLTGNMFDPGQAPTNDSYQITYTYTDGNNCTFSETQSFVVFTPPNVSFEGLLPELCSNGGIITLTGAPAGGVFSTTAPVGLSGNELDPTDIPTETIYSITYTFSAGSGGGCSGSQTQEFIVHKPPTVSFSGLNASYCSDAQPVTLNGIPATGIFTTTAPAGLTSNILDPAQVPTGTTYTASYTYTGANGCFASDVQSFIVNALPAVSFSGLSAAYCADVPPVTLTGNPAGGAFSSTAPAGLSGNVLTPGQVPTETTFNLTYTYTDGNSCSNSQTQTFIVHALPVLGITGLSPSYCIDDDAFTVSGSPSGGLFSTDAPTGLNGNTLDPVQIPAETNFSLSYQYTDGNGCSNVLSQAFIVHALPVVGFSGLDPAYCANNGDVTLNGSPAGGVFSTDAPGGLSGDLLDPSLIPAGNTFTVSYVYTDGNSCSNMQSQSFLVNALPAVGFSGLTPTYCANEPAVTLSGDPAGGVFSSTATSGLAGNTLDPGQSPTGSTEQLTYTLTDANGCANSQTQPYSVFALPLLSFTDLADTYCSSDAPVPLSGVPAGGQFTADPPTVLNDLNPGTGFFPATEPGGGNATVIYTYQTADGCTVSTQQTTTILEAPAFELGDTIIVCGDSGVITVEPMNVDFTYLWSTGATTPDIMVSGDGVYSVSVTAPNGCSTRDSAQIFNNSGLQFISNLLVSGTACQDDTLHFFDISEVLVGVDNYFWDFGDGNTSTEQDPVHIYAATGTYQVTLEATLAGCSNLSLAKPVMILNCRESGSGAGGIFEAVVAAPNPTEDVFYIDIALHQKKDARLQVVDVQGRIVETRFVRGEAQYREEFSGLQPGVYFVHVLSLNQTLVVKVIVV